MILILIIGILIAGGILSWITGKWNPAVSRVIAAMAVAADLLIVLSIFLRYGLTDQTVWIDEFSASWIPEFGIGIHLALDGLSLLMLLLTFFIGLIAIIDSWKEAPSGTGFFHLNIQLVLAGITGVFLSVDLFLFYFFWELMLIPMYFLIGIWGDEKRIPASNKFFIYTQAGGLLMFLSILGLYLVHASNTGIYTFDYGQLLGTSMVPSVELLLMGGFLAGFLVKLPAFPLHTWSPDAYSHGPRAGTIILAALMAKTAAYGLIRFAVPLFPNASYTFAPAGMIIGVAGILYGALLAMSQTDIKRLIAYTSVSHMGFIVLGVYAFNEMAYQGVVMQMIAHGISTAALFIIAGKLFDRTGTYNIVKMGGLWEKIPATGAMGMIFSLALLGLPGLGNFVAEFLTLGGTFKSSVLFSSLASLGLIIATVYSLRLVQKVFFGKPAAEKEMKDLSFKESVVLGTLVIAIVITGLFPQIFIKRAAPALNRTIQVIGPRKNARTFSPEIRIKDLNPPAGASSGQSL